MKREKMLNERRCGLKHWDKAVEMVGVQAIIDKAIAIHNDFPDVWGAGWRNFDWALGNAVREIACDPNKQYAMSWNVNDVLTEEEMHAVAERCQFSGQYEPCWKHT
jgi:hypothetical protein